MSAASWMCLLVAALGLWDISRAYRGLGVARGARYVIGGLVIGCALVLFALSQRGYTTPIPPGWSTGYSSDPLRAPDERRPCPAEDLTCAALTVPGSVLSFEVRPSGGQWDGDTDSLRRFAAVTMDSLPRAVPSRLDFVDTVEMGGARLGRYVASFGSVGHSGRVLVYVVPVATWHLSVQYVAGDADYERHLPEVDAAVRGIRGPFDVTLFPVILVGLVVVAGIARYALGRRAEA